MNEDKESLLESFQDSAAEAAQSAEVSPEPAPDADSILAGGLPQDDLGAVADALLEADGVSAEPSLGDIPAPDENSDPAMAVEEMLSAAVLDEATVESAIGLGADPGAAPTFQVKVAVTRGVSEELKKIAADMGLTLAEAVLASSTPLISQLTEFQALYLLQRLKALGLHGSVEVKRPASAPTEEDLALGGLSSVPDDSPVHSEGAPSVQLPANEKGVLLYSGDSLPAFPVTQTLGVVTSHRSLARRFFRDDEVDDRLKREMERMPGRSASSLPKSRLEGIFRELFLDLQKAALAVSGNAVLGVRIQTFPESNSLDPSLEQMRLVAFGTAAVVEKWDP
ncbi:MAG: hypothetical protein ACXVBE_05785 [Bdellovibrionota bacterium]